MPSSNEIASCKKKIRFSSDAAAQAARKKINPAKRLKRPYRVYKCPVCFGWHLTSQPKKR
jgi:hypothetical protein